MSKTQNSTSAIRKSTSEFKIPVGNHWFVEKTASGKKETVKSGLRKITERTKGISEPNSEIHVSNRIFGPEVGVLLKSEIVSKSELITRKTKEVIPVLPF